MESFNLKSYVLVTGGSGGIGSEICRQLSVLGFTPIICYNTNALNAEKIASETSGVALSLDLKNDKSIKMCVEDICGLLSFDSLLHGVILCASPPPITLPFTQATRSDIEHLLDINVIGNHLLLSSLIKKIFNKKNNGVVLAILSDLCSSNLKPATKGRSSYVLAKSSLKSLLEICHAEFPWIKVKYISPGPTDTKMLSTLDRRLIEYANKNHSIATPEYVANLIVKEFLS